MPEKDKKNYWLFSNRPAGHSKEIWDMGWILQNNRYSLKEKEKNLQRFKVGDIVYMREYGQNIIGSFTIGSLWEQYEDQLWDGVVVGTIEMLDLVHWERTLPQSLIINDLSNKNHRARVISLTREDAIIIETAQKIYARLGFGGEDENILLLEQGIEEAIKPNLNKLGLRLAEKKIQQQFDMGIGVGISDLICRDKDNNLVILELKRGMTSDQTVGQLLRYMGWVQENNILKEGQKVKGCIISGDFDEHLRLAAKAADIRLVLVRII